MPKRRVEGRWTPSGKQVEEMIYNFMHNKKYVGYQVEKYFGATHPRDVMQKWNWDIKVYAGTDPVVKPLGLAPRNTSCWKRYHDYVASEGVPTFHADYDEKTPIRPSREKLYTAAACRGICDLVHSLWTLWLLTRMSINRSPVGLAASLKEQAASTIQTTEKAGLPNDLLNKTTMAQEIGSSSPGESLLPTAAPSSFNNPLLLFCACRSAIQWLRQRDVCWIFSLRRI